jgi:hypothetical protein
MDTITTTSNTTNPGHTVPGAVPSSAGPTPEPDPFAGALAALQRAGIEFEVIESFHLDRAA